MARNIRMMESPSPGNLVNNFSFSSEEGAVFWTLSSIHLSPGTSPRLESGGVECKGERSISFNQEQEVVVLVVRNTTEGYCRFNITRGTHHYIIRVTWKPSRTKPRNLMKRIKELKENNFKKRKLLDAFGDSLLYVNTLYNKEYGYVQRKVPAHMPHLLDKNILEEMELKYQTSWDRTGSHKLRSASDIQYSFAYFHYLLQEKTQQTVEQVFDYFDTDRSGTLSDREIRTILARIHPLPLSFKNVQEFENEILKCWGNFSPNLAQPATPPNERYFQSKLPIVTKELIANCPEISNAFKIHFSERSRFAHEIVKHPDVAFRQLTSNLSMVVAMLDTLRKVKRKLLRNI